MNAMTDEFPDVDTLMRVAQDDPEGLESIRDTVIDALIESAPNEQIKRKLRGLCFKVDVERERAATPLAACIKLSQMMHNSLGELHLAMVAPDLHSEHARVSQAPDNVIAFSRDG